MKKYHAFVLWEDTFTDTDQRIRIMANPTIAKDSPLNADRLFFNKEIYDLMRSFSNNIDFTIIYRWTKRPVVERFQETNRFRANDRICLTYMKSDFWSRVVVPKLNESDEHELLFICEDKYLSEIRGNSSFNDLLKNRKNVKIKHFQPCYFGPSWGHFRAYTECNKSADNYTALLSSSLSALSNCFCYILDKPKKTCFLNRNSITSNQLFTGKIPYRNQELYLFNYYSTSTETTIKDSFSKHLVSMIKNGTAANHLSSFFCEALLNHIEKSAVKLSRCMFLIYPSSKENKWNPVLMDSMQTALLQHGCQAFTLKGLHRIKTVQKQHLSNDRNPDTQINSIRLEIEHPEQYDFAVVIDDFTSSGTSFNAAAAILRNAGFNGSIQPYAVGGTQYYSTRSLINKLPFDHNRRETAPYGFIFDLDNTIIETDIAEHCRGGENWLEAYDLIPQMKQYYCVAYTIKQLIKQGIDVAIVTSSITEYCYRILRFIGIRPNDVVCVCYHDTKKHKPDPDPYLAAERLMKHYNKNIFCVGDQLSDVEACDNANKIDYHHNYVPILAYWQSSSWAVLPDGKTDIKVFINELQLLKFIGSVIPLRSTLDNLINKILRPMFYNLAYTNEQFYELLQANGYLQSSRPGCFIPTEKGRVCGMSGSVSLPSFHIYEGSEIICDYFAQCEIINLISLNL